MCMYFCNICTSLSVCNCMYACNTISFESLDAKVHFRSFGISRGDTGRVYLKVIGSRSRSQEPRGEKSLFQYCKPSIGNNSRSTKHRAMSVSAHVVFDYGGSNGVTAIFVT